MVNKVGSKYRYPKYMNFLFKLLPFFLFVGSFLVSCIMIIIIVLETIRVSVPNKFLVQLWPFSVLLFFYAVYVYGTYWWSSPCDSFVIFVYANNLLQNLSTIFDNSRFIPTLITAKLCFINENETYFTKQHFYLKFLLF